MATLSMLSKLNVFASASQPASDNPIAQPEEEGAPDLNDVQELEEIQELEELTTLFEGGPKSERAATAPEPSPLVVHTGVSRVRYMHLRTIHSNREVAAQVRGELERGEQERQERYVAWNSRVQSQAAVARVESENAARRVREHKQQLLEKAKAERVQAAALQKAAEEARQEQMDAYQQLAQNERAEARRAKERRALQKAEEKQERRSEEEARLAMVRAARQKAQRDKREAVEAVKTTTSTMALDRSLRVVYEEKLAKAQETRDTARTWRCAAEEGNGGGGRGTEEAEGNGGGSRESLPPFWLDLGSLSWRPKPRHL